MSSCSPCVTITTTTISFSFESSKPPSPPGYPDRAESIDSLEYIDPPVSPSRPPLLGSEALPLDKYSYDTVPKVIGSSDLTPGAANRWYSVTVGTNVGVFQGW